MRKVVLLCMLALTFFNCKKDKKDIENLQVNEIEKVQEDNSKSADGFTTIAGEYVYFDDAAVLQTKTGMFGVIMDTKMQELNNLVEQYKSEDTDFVPVTIRGKIIPKPEGTEGWDYNIEIKEIIKVERPTEDNTDVIKLGTN